MFATLFVLCVNSITCFAIDVKNITQQHNIKGVYSWYNEFEFYYYTEDQEWFLYNIRSNTYRKAGQYSESEWTGNQNVKGKFSDDARTLFLKDEKNKNTKTIKLSQDFNTFILSVSNTGRYIGLCLTGPMEDENKWVLFNWKSSEFISIPMGQAEFSFGTIAWANDDKYIAIDIVETKAVDSEFADIYKSGILIYDIEKKKVVKRYLSDSTDACLVKGFKYPHVLYLNENDQLCIYNITTNTASLIYKGKMNNVLWGPNKEVYGVIDNKLVKVIL